jgi:hypothetical protein
MPRDVSAPFVHYFFCPMFFLSKILVHAERVVDG